MTAITLLLLTLGLAPDGRQQKVVVRVEVRSDGQPIPDAKVTAAGIGRRTATGGVVTFDVAPGVLHITISKPGFLDAQTEVDVAAGRERIVIVELPLQPVVEEETTVVASTRTGRRLEDEPVRVEVLGREEIEERCS